MNGLAVKILSKGKEVPEELVVDNNKNLQKSSIEIQKAHYFVFVSEFETNVKAT
jgi:hypothetical protein